MDSQPLILLVDDEASFQEILGTKLGASGFRVVSARNEKEALEKAESLMPDLILMDISMPGGSGTDAALAIKQNEKTRSLKIAFLTNMSDPWPTIAADRKKVAQAVGAEDFLEKTDDLNLIVAKAREILARK